MALPDPVRVGDLLRHHRIAAALSQEALAERAGLSVRAIGDLERGTHRVPRLETLRLLAEALALNAAGRTELLAAAYPQVMAPRAHKRPPSRPPTSLPVPLTRLIGRETEVASIGRLLAQDDVRLITLTGPGGTGKTRLAQAVAAELLDEFPDGSWFVDLAPLSDPTLVLSTIARTLGLRESGGQVVLEALSAFLAAKRLVLVLDNYEHVLEAAPVVSHLLQAGAATVALVTSREPLRLQGEREFAVAPLALPDPHRHPSRTNLAQNPAVALFVQRAQAAKADFVLTDENAADVAAICKRVDGLPLAIELAAARVKVLPPSALLARLDTRLPLLVGGPRDAPLRQRSLRDTVAWSHELLNEEECILFRRLGIFAGGWTFEAADAVTNVDGSLDVFAGITSLVDKSLVRQSDQAAGEPRFAMLETIREFALEHLRRQSPEEGVIRRAHTRFFTDLALAARADIDAGVPDAIKRVGAEEDNLRAMLAQLLEAGDAETALRVIGGSLSVYWTVAGGQLAEARTWLDRAFRHGTGASPTARALGLYGLTIVTLFQGDFATARTAATECRSLARLTDDPVLGGWGPLALSLVEEAEGRMDAAGRFAVEALEAARTLDDPGTLGWSLRSLGTAQWHAGDLAAATSTLEEALALFRGCDGVWGACNTLMNLAGVARSEGNLARAARLHADSLHLRRDAGVLADAFYDLIGIAESARAMGHEESAARLLGAEDTYRAVFGSLGWGATPMLRERTRQALVEQLGDERFAWAWDAGRALSTEQVMVEALALADDLSVHAKH
jgi:predicted ATPase/DNA-binding XRE family transcriptional regulator